MKIYEIDQNKLDIWLNDRPEIIKELTKKCPPDRLYRLKTTGQRGEIESYFEDGTVKMRFPQVLNFFQMCDLSVFGINPGDIIETD